MRYSLYQLPEAMSYRYIITYNGSPTLVTDQAFKDVSEAVKYINGYRRLVEVADSRLITLQNSIKLADFDLTSTLIQTHPELFL